MGIVALGDIDVETTVNVFGDASYQETFTQTANSTYDVNISVDPNTVDLDFDTGNVDTSVASGNEVTVFQLGLDYNFDVSGSITVDEADADSVTGDNIWLEYFGEEEQLAGSISAYPITIDFDLTNVEDFNAEVILDNNQTRPDVQVTDANFTMSIPIETTVDSVTQS